jgi:hypothetical protein
VLWLDNTHGQLVNTHLSLEKGLQHLSMPQSGAPVGVG